MFTIEPSPSRCRRRAFVKPFCARGWITMRIVTLRALTAVMSCSMAFLITVLVNGADESGWVESIGEDELSAWRKPTGDWIVAGDSAPDLDHPKLLVAKPGKGTIVNGKTGKTRNLLSRQEFGDLEAHFEFLVPKGSNSGVKFEGFYEIQIADSFGVKKPTGSHCGGIYPRAEMLPRYHHIDEGTPPLVNAASCPGGVAGARRCLPSTAICPRRHESRKRPVRESEFERPGDSRKRRCEGADRSCLAAAGDRQGADLASGRPWSGGIPKDPRPGQVNTGTEDVLPGIAARTTPSSFSCARSRSVCVSLCRRVRILASSSREGRATAPHHAAINLLRINNSALSPKFQDRLVGIPITVNDLRQSRLPVSGYILINLSASACKASASVTW